MIRYQEVSDLEEEESSIEAESFIEAPIIGALGIFMVLPNRSKLAMSIT
jgi:hypothetical protein